MIEPSPRQRVLVLAICCMSLLIVSLDNTVLNVALPSMRRDLDASVSGLQWSIDAYTLVLASLLMLAGSTADRIGRRKVFVAGLVAFTVGSLLCSLAPSLDWLIVFRMVQAVGGAMLNPVAMSIITNTFTDPAERARAIGVWGAVGGISMAAGPLIGGVLVDSVGWRSIFLINLPIGLAALALTLRHIQESRAARPRRPDPLGQVLVIALLGSLTYGIIEAPAAGWRSPLIMGCAVVAVASFVGLLIHEPRCKEPLIDLRFFRSAPFSGATVIAISAFAGLAGFLFLNTLYLQDVRGLSALHAGLYMLPMAGLTVLFAPLAGRLVGSRGPRICLLIAGVSMAASGLLFALFEAETSNPLLFTGYMLFGLGFGMVNAPDHQYGGVRDAALPGGRRGRHRLHQPADRRHPGRRGDRLRAGVRAGERLRLLGGGPAGVVDHHALRAAGPGRGRGDERRLGPRDGGTDRPHPGGAGGADRGDGFAARLGGVRGAATRRTRSPRPRC